MVPQGPRVELEELELAEGTVETDNKEVPGTPEGMEGMEARDNLVSE